MRISKPGAEWELWRWLLIPDISHPERTYLKRLRIVQTPWFGLYLHRIYLPDGDRHLHDHPWKFASLIVRGWYKEELNSNPRNLEYYNNPNINLKTHRRGSLHKMPLEWAHRIHEVSPNLVTLVFAGKRVKQWGFWTENGWVYFEDYLKTKIDEMG